MEVESILEQLRYYRDEFPREAAERMWGDIVTEDLPNVLASICGVDTGPIRRLIEDPRVGEYARTGLVSCCYYIHPGELMEEVRRAYDEEMVEPFFIGLDDLEQNASRSVEEVLAELRENPSYRLFDDAVGTLAGSRLLRSEIRFQRS